MLGTVMVFVKVCICLGYSIVMKNRMPNPKYYNVNPYCVWFTQLGCGSYKYITMAYFLCVQLHVNIHHEDMFIFTILH